jgi:dTDP-glucose 4,6-dehydratase
VEDCVEGIDNAFRRGTSGEIYNIGGTTELENKKVAEMLCASLKQDALLIEPVTDRLGHDFRYSLNSSKAQRDLNWHPKTSFEDGLAKTVEYYARH